MKMQEKSNKSKNPILESYVSGKEVECYDVLKGRICRIKILLPLRSEEMNKGEITKDFAVSYHGKLRVASLDFNKKKGEISEDLTIGQSAEEEYPKKMLKSIAKKFNVKY
jgi:hypothetical protein